MPNERDIDELDQADDNDDTPPGIVKRLNKIGRVQTKINARLDAITARFGNPPDPIKPDLRNALDTIKAQSTATTAKADALIVKVSPPTIDV